MAASPTSRSLAHLRKLGFTAQVVEKFNYFTKQRKDLFGCIDIIAIHPEQKRILGVQATSLSNIQSRVKKSEEEPMLQTWFAAGGLFQVHGWGKKGAKGKRKLWELKTIVLSLK